MARMQRQQQQVIERIQHAKYRGVLHVEVRSLQERVQHMQLQKHRENSEKILILKKNNYVDNVDSFKTMIINIINEEKTNVNFKQQKRNAPAPNSNV